jgi:hypothetical protein
VTLPLAFSAILEERFLVGVASVSWIAGVVTVMQSSREVKASATARQRAAQEAGLDVILAAPDALTPRGLVLRRRFLVLGTLFLFSIGLLVVLLAKSTPSPPLTSSVVSFHSFHG